MKRSISPRFGGRLARTAAVAMVVAAGSVTLIGCVNDLLDVRAPTRVLADDLEGAETASLLVGGAVGDFECALASYINVTGQVTDEFVGSNLASAEAFDLDRRTVDPHRTHYALNGCGGLEGVYTPVSTARWQADNVLAKLEGYSDTEVTGRMGLIATAAAYSGYSHILLGEGFCSAAVDGGPELTSAQVFALAETRFTRAIAAATAAGSGSAAILNMALVGRARARMNQGKNTEALADAQLVPANFVRNATYSAAASRSENLIHRLNNLSTSVSIDAPFRNLTFGGVADPRVPVTNANRNGNDNVTPLWIQTKYPALDSPIPIASWEEAQLIIAEISGGTTAVNIINALHTRAGLPSFSSTDPATIAAQVLEERTREFFLEGHHFWDVRRFNLPQVPAAGTSYGFKGGFYGTTRCLPLPDAERNRNDNIS